MIPLNYHHLYYFWVVAKSGSITAARERLLLAQPTLSLQLAQLERSCGGRLLERSRQGVTLTALGQQVFEHCERIFSEGDALATFLKAGPTTPSIRLGIESTITREAVLHLIDRAHGWAPNVRLGLFGGAVGLIPRFRRRNYDLLLMSKDPSADLGPGYRVRLAAELPVSFYANRELARKGETLKQALARLPILLRPQSHPVREQTDVFFARHSITPRIEAELDDVELLKRLVLQGRGAAALQHVTVAAEPDRTQLVRLQEKPTGIVDRIWLVGPTHVTGAPEARKLLEQLMDRFAFS